MHMRRLLPRTAFADGPLRKTGERPHAVVHHDGPGHRDVCPAKDKTCNDCGRKGHFAGNDYCPLKKQKKPPILPPPPSALKKSQPKAGPAVTEEDKKKASRARKVAAAIKLLEEEDPTALSASVPPSPPSPSIFQHMGQGHYPSALQMLPSPYYSTLAPPPPTYPHRYWRCPHPQLRGWP